MPPAGAAPSSRPRNRPSEAQIAAARGRAAGQHRCRRRLDDLSSATLRNSPRPKPRWNGTTGCSTTKPPSAPTAGWNRSPSRPSARAWVARSMHTPAHITWPRVNHGTQSRAADSRSTALEIAALRLGSRGGGRAPSLAPPAGRARDGRRHHDRCGHLPHAERDREPARPPMAHVRGLDRRRRGRAPRRADLRRARHAPSAGRRQVRLRRQGVRAARGLRRRPRRGARYLRRRIAALAVVAGSTSRRLAGWSPGTSRLARPGCGRRVHRRQHPGRRPGSLGPEHRDHPQGRGPRRHRRARVRRRHRGRLGRRAAHSADRRHGHAGRDGRGVPGR